MSNAYGDRTNGVSGMGAYVGSADTQAVPDAQYDPATTVATGQIVDQTPPAAPTTPVSSLASGIGGVLLFPGRIIVQQFVGTGDPMDMSHMPVTILLSAAAWYAAYYFLFASKHGQSILPSFLKKASRPRRKVTTTTDEVEE